MTLFFEIGALQPSVLLRLHVNSLQLMCFLRRKIVLTKHVEG